MAEERRTLLIRLGELTLKSKRVRQRFTLRLLQNLKAALDAEGIRDYRVINEWSRLFVEVPEGQEKEAREVLRRVFGIASLSPVEVMYFRTIRDLENFAEQMYALLVDGRTFAVRVKRVGRHPFRSIDVERLVGGRLARYGTVDLENPEVLVEIEIREHQAFFFVERIAGPGGLPLGTEGKALALVSGGFDSAVAAWLMMKRGVALDFVLFNLGGPLHLKGTLDVVQTLCRRWCYGTDPVFHEVDFRAVVQDLHTRVKENYWNLILKRLMYRAAARLAREIGVPAVVTGESIGQVSSQTFVNLTVLEEAAEVPVFRPLLTYDKQEIIDLARRIGTYEVSAAVAEYCQLVARHPVTRANPQRVRELEERLNPELLARAVKERRSFPLRAAPAEVLGNVEVDTVPEGAVILDVRRRADPPIPGARRIPADRFREAVATLDPSVPYVLVCESGYRSFELARDLQQQGFRAYSLKGGARWLLKHMSSA